ncbi:hypothetical protein PSV08DRAFT_251740 [Bipolaris maydis]|uniref:uncharacterized protein n=1 Tax=Cochliobolus heterostrophus TaxID=5016 RepID=UPI0024D73C69|nr:hypothetical protein J3E73DRAFT_258880 [Bipolaris maydis]KAJ6265994.1 hypothetical protein PSV08DRAFT_251740 [Bipolaris maydis]KAJ6281012.1 hypothetical protein J3E71DRAFT_241287 [Bipolaris maydis]
MTGAHSGPGLGDAIRKGVNMVHGTGEAIRGNAMSMVDEASGDKASAFKNQEIANKGVDEWDSGYRGHATSAGVAPTNTTSTSTNYGPHDSNIGNKLDPRFDSDTDHRGTATNSTNAGPHSTNMGNKLDPRFDSDQDHRADPTSTIGAGLHTVLPLQQTDVTDDKEIVWNPSHGLRDTWHVSHKHQHGPNPPHEHRGSIGALSGLEAAKKLDPVFSVRPDAESMKYTSHANIHRLRGSISGASGLQAAQKLDPPTFEPAHAPSEVLAHGPGHNQPDPSYYHPKPTYQSNVAKSLYRSVGVEEVQQPDSATTGSRENPIKSITKSSMEKGEAESTLNTQKTESR